MNLEELVAQGMALREAARVEAAAQRAAALLGERVALANGLPAEAWAALGVAPLAAIRRESGIEVEGTVAVEEGLTLGVEARFWDRRRRVRFTFQTRNFGEKTLKDVYLESGDVQVNLAELARGLAAAVAEVRQVAEEDRSQRVKELRGWLREGDRTAAKLRERLGELDGLTWLTKVERAECVLLGLAMLEDAETRERAAAEAKRQDAEITGQVRELARVHLAEWAAYGAACQAWAEGETARLWRPWSVWRVRYAPDFIRPGVPVDEVDGVDGTELIQVVMVLDAECRFWSGQRVLVALRNGQLHNLVIGAFLDAELVEWKTPELSEELAYHRATRAGAWVVNAPAVVVEPPGPAPAAPASWRERLGGVAQTHDWRLRERVGNWEPEQWAADATDENG